LALAGPTPGTVPEPVDTTKPLEFTPPAPVTTTEEVAAKPKRKLKLPKPNFKLLLRRKVLMSAGIGVVILLLGGGAYAAIDYMRTQASPDTIYQQALAKALMTPKVTVTQQSGADTTVTQLDLSSLKDPKISGQATVNIGGASYQFKTYGSKANTFMSYTHVPDGIAAATATAVTDRWVTLRKAGQLPAAINATLGNAADPRFEAYGPLLWANLSPKDSQVTAKFLVDHHVYSYKLINVKTESINGKKALHYSGTFDADYAKIAVQSLANSEGFQITEVQRAVDALTRFKGAGSDLYIDRGTRLPVRLMLKTKAGQSYTYDYSTDKVQVSGQPTSTTDWPQFATTQLQLEAQASAKQTAEQRDAVRQTDLTAIQLALTGYKAKQGSYPTLNDLNNQTWLAVNLPNFDPDLTRDPQSTSLALLASKPAATPTAKAKTAVAATPIYGYVYQPTNDAGKACVNDAAAPADQLCTKYTLAATLSNGSQLTLTNP